MSFNIELLVARKVDERIEITGQPERLLSCNSFSRNLFHFGRHLMQAKHYPALSYRSFY
ncbi:hypothetical protein MT391_00420 [Vibrio sp. 1-Bac 57]|uniref:hypothetical protein n=1 Tax=Psychromonas sp. SA13A TaxID=2686346 RepID=UPI001409CDAF|nr:hypothetical protein [Psychromonas sp. SA13A]